MPGIRSISFSAALTAGLVLVGCSDQAQIDSMHTQIRALEEAQRQSEKEGSRAALQLRSLQAEHETLKQERDGLTKELKATKADLVDLRAEFDDYKEQYKVEIRQRAPGMELGNLELDGRSYRNARIRQVTAQTVVILHDEGTASFSLSQLDEGLRTKLGFDESVAAENGKPGDSD